MHYDLITRLPNEALKKTKLICPGMSLISHSCPNALLPLIDIDASKPPHNRRRVPATYAVYAALPADAAVLSGLQGGFSSCRQQRQVPGTAVQS
ncbi:hypothetical protein ABBQ32_003480 [Trebouxia sp. C0010 RCD-2024]